MQATTLPITLPRWAKPAYYVVVGFLSLVGVVSVLVRLIYGMKVTALTSPIPWGMWVVIYIYFIGLSVGSFLMSTLVYVFGMHRYEKVGRMALLSALFALFGGMLFIWIDLGHPERFWYIFNLHPLEPNFRFGVGVFLLPVLHRRHPLQVVVSDAVRFSQFGGEQ